MSMANEALIRAMAMAEAQGLPVREIADELRIGMTELFAERVGDDVRLRFAGATTIDLGTVPALLLARRQGPARDS